MLPGLAPFARDELTGVTGAWPAPPGDDDESADAVPFSWDESAARDGIRPLHTLRTVTAVNRVTTFDVPRPKALLGDAHFRRLVAEIGRVLEGWREPMRGLRLEAAGSDSPVMRRLREELASATGLDDAPVDGELRLRLRPGRGGWQALVRLTPRPLSARPWRTCNLPGGLNACVAAAAWELVGTEAQARVLNAMCGSGTLLIERAAAGPVRRLVGVDLDDEALRCCEANLASAGVEAELVAADAARTGLPSASFDAIVADPPWGDAVSDPAGIAALYPAFLTEAARLLVPGGRLLVVTHALRAFEGALGDARGWRDEGGLRVFHGGHRPALRLLQKA